MQVLINELSLEGQFICFIDFREALVDFLRILKFLADKKCEVLKKYDFYDYHFSETENFNSILRINDDAITRFKSLIAESLHNGFWECDQKHINELDYHCNLTELKSGYSIAEACHRDKIVISFPRGVFQQESIQVSKNGDDNYCIKNIVAPHNIYQFFLENNLISAYDFCLVAFLRTKLDFSKLEAAYGFDALTKDELNSSIASFMLFSSMSWSDITSNKGLNYKQYSPKGNAPQFKSSKFPNEKIFKFRLDGKCRSFGFRSGDVFYVLALERDHVWSDNG